MANRHLSRSIVLQTLFEWDFNLRVDEEVSEILDRNIVEFGPGLNDSTFMNELATLVLTKRKIIDDIIEKAAPDWPISKISITDRNILRIGLAELLFGDRTQVPPKVAINEAIELAKSFGGENSGRFVNGVLGAVYKEIGEPGKDDISKKKKEEEVDLTKIPVERKAGAVIYSIHEGKAHFAMVHDVFGFWTLSKGGVDEGDTDEDAVVREIKDEIGLDIEVVKKLGENEYIASHPEKGKIRKHVVYFLTKGAYGPLSLHSSGGLDESRWFSMEQVGDLKMYDDVIPLMAQSIEYIAVNESDVSSS